MKKTLVILLAAIMVFVQGCGVSQEEFDALTQEKKELSENVKKLNSDLETVKSKNKQLEDEKAVRVKEELKMATPKAWAVTHFGEHCIVLADNEEYMQVISEKTYSVSDAAVKSIMQEVTTASLTLKKYFDDIKYKRIAVKFPMKNGAAMMEIILKRGNGGYEFEAALGDLFKSNKLLVSLGKAVK